MGPRFKVSSERLLLARVSPLIHFFKLVNLFVNFLKLNIGSNVVKRTAISIALRENRVLMVETHSSTWTYSRALHERVI